MAARNQSRALEIADQFMRMIADHARNHPEKWFKTPQTVERGARLRHLDSPRPLVICTIEGSDPEDATANAQERYDVLELALIGAIEDPSDPEAAICELAADIRRAVAENRQLPDSTGTIRLGTGMIEEAGYKLSVDPSDAGGRAECKFKVLIPYLWDAVTA